MNDKELLHEGLLPGVCCRYCVYFEKSDCPVKQVSSWSKWKDYCGQYKRKDKYIIDGAKTMCEAWLDVMIKHFTELKRLFR